MPQGLCIKVSAQPLIRKWFFIFRQIKLDFSQERLCTWPHFENEGLWDSVVCEQALLFGRAKQAARERASERQSREEAPAPSFRARASRASAFHDIPKWRACSQARDSEVAYQFWGRNSIAVQKFKLYETILTVALIPFRISQKICYGIFLLNFDWSPLGIKF